MCVHSNELPQFLASILLTLIAGSVDDSTIHQQTQVGVPNDQGSELLTEVRAECPWRQIIKIYLVSPGFITLYRVLFAFLSEIIKFRSYAAITVECIKEVVWRYSILYG